MDPTIGNQRRQELLQWLMAQGYGLGAGNPSGLGASMAPTPLGIGMAAARGAFGGPSPFFARNHDHAGAPSFTSGALLPPGLIARLGPGGGGRGNPQEQSPGPGLPVVAPPKVINEPHGNGPSVTPPALPVTPPPIPTAATTQAAPAPAHTTTAPAAFPAPAPTPAPAPAAAAQAQINPQTLMAHGPAPAPVAAAPAPAPAAAPPAAALAAPAAPLYPVLGLQRVVGYSPAGTPNTFLDPGTLLAHGPGGMFR